ncbi:MAG: AIM24 family protein [Haloplanus sp.]
MTLDELASANAPTEGGDSFQLQNRKLLAVNLDGAVTALAGSMVAYSGDVTFSGKTSAEGGVTGFIKSKATSEGTPVMKAKGTGRLYLADGGKEVGLVTLDKGESISVNGNDVLAFADTVNYRIGTIDSLAGSSAGGLTNVSLTGPGEVAITTHGDPVVLEPPVRTDPSATVAWTGSLSPSADVNRSLSDLVGQSSDETYQLSFEGEAGFVVVQPFEEGP